MATITAIKPQKNGKRLNIYLDGKFGFGLDLETFVKHQLKDEQELSETEIEKIVKEGEFQKVYDKVLLFGSLRPRSEAEFNRWLSKHKVHQSLHRELFNRLKRLELLDDNKFARWWVGQRMQFKSKSKKELEQELRMKGISKDIIEDVISEAQPNELEMAKRLIDKKSYVWEKMDDITARRKKTEYLLRRGYDWEIIRAIVRKIDAEDDNV